MALLFTESWDGIGSTFSDYLGKWSGSQQGGAIVAGRNGNGLSNGNISHILDNADQRDTLIAGFAWKPANIGETPLFVFLGDGSNLVNQVVLSRNANGGFFVHRGSPSQGGNLLLGTSADNLYQAGVWHFVEIKAVLASSDSANDGSVVVRLDGVEVLNLTSKDTWHSGTEDVFCGFMFYMGNGVTTAGIGDDLYILNDVDSGVSGRPNNAFLGDCFVEALFPNGNGTTSQMDGSDGNQTDNYLLVDETGANDGDTTYVESGDDNDKDTYNYEDTSGSGSVAGVGVYTWAKRTESGPRDLAIVSRYSGTEEDSADKTLASGYACLRHVFESDPAGSAWTLAKVDAAEFGVKSRPS